MDATATASSSFYALRCVQAEAICTNIIKSIKRILRGQKEPRQRSKAVCVYPRLALKQRPEGWVTKSYTWPSRASQARTPNTRKPWLVASPRRLFHGTRCKQGGSHARCNAPPARSAAPDRRGPALAHSGDTLHAPLCTGAGSLLQRDGSASFAETCEARETGMTPYTHLPARTKKWSRIAFPSLTTTRGTAEGHVCPPPARCPRGASLQETSSCPQTPCPRPPG